MAFLHYFKCRDYNHYKYFIDDAYKIDTLVSKMETVYDVQR